MVQELFLEPFCAYYEIKKTLFRWSILNSSRTYFEAWRHLTSASRAGD